MQIPKVEGWGGAWGSAFLTGGAAAAAGPHTLRSKGLEKRYLSGF